MREACAMKVFAAQVGASCGCRVPSAARQWVVCASDHLGPTESVQRRLDHLPAKTLSLVLCAALAATRDARGAQFTFCAIGDPVGRQRRKELAADPAEANRHVLRSTSVLHVIERLPSDFVPNNAVYHAVQQLYLSHAGRAALNELISSTEPSHDGDSSNLESFDSCCCGSGERASPLIGSVESTKLEEASAANAAVALETVPGAKSFWFWPHKVDVASCIPFASQHFVVLVNLKPIVPLHLMVVPRRVVSALHELTRDEALEWGMVLEKCFQALKVAEVSCEQNGFSVAVQQGPLAGQTVPHLHTHVIPFDPNGLLAGEPEDDEAGARRRPRSLGEMEEETITLKKIFAALT